MFDHLFQLYSHTVHRVTYSTAAGTKTVMQKAYTPVLKQKMKSTTKENAMRKKGKAARPCAFKVGSELNVDTGGKKAKSDLSVH